MGVFTGQELLNQKGEKVNAEAELSGKVILVYFSAHWCPPCRGFTPILKDFYEELKDAGKPVAIVFVSSDRSEEDMKSYFNEHHGDWLCAQFGSEMGSMLKKNCEVTGIPTLAVVNMEGKMLHKEGRPDVQNMRPEKAFEKFQGISK